MHFDSNLLRRYLCGRSCHLPSKPVLEKPLQCPLCCSTTIKPFHKDKQREYHQCGKCQLVFVSAPYHLSYSCEKAEYDKHNNQFGDAGYLAFLSRSFLPAIDWIKHKIHRSGLLHSCEPVVLRGIDFGCGPTPVLAIEIRDQVQAHLNDQMTKHSENDITYSLSFDMQYYDPMYFPATELAESSFDLVTCTEVVEHFRSPVDSWRQLISLMTADSCLVVMTKLVIDCQRFASWHYKNDPTHVAFYSKETFEFIANAYQLNYQQLSTDVAMFCKR